MARICLISSGHLSTNPRLVKEALALKAAGHRIHVVHGRFTSWGTANDPTLAACIGSTRAVPFGPTQASMVTYFRQTVVRRAARGLASRSIKLVPWLAENANSPVSGDLRAAALEHRADLYIAHYVAALPAAARAAQRHNALYAFDAEDFHLGDLPDKPEHALEKQIVRAIEGRFLPNAAFVTAASPMIAEAYTEAYGISLPTTILNVFPRKHAPPAPTPEGVAEPKPSLYWFSQTLGPGRGLETALEAIARAASRPHLYLRGAPAGTYAQELKACAMRAGVGERLHLLDPADPRELERLGGEYDLGLIGETASTRSRGIALTNKLFSYLSSGVPSLASDIPAHRRIAPLLGDAMTLFAMSDASALAAAIDSLLLDRQRLAAARVHAWRLGQEQFSWETVAPFFLAQVSAALTKG